MTENIRQYIPGIDNISCELTEQISTSIKNNKKSGDFLEDLSKIFLECMWFVLKFYINFTNIQLIQSYWFGDIRYAIRITASGINGRLLSK